MHIFLFNCGQYRHCVAALAKHRDEREQQVQFGDENLGENFDETPWVPPTLEVVSIPRLIVCILCTVF